MPAWNDERLEQIVSRLLIAGVILSAAVVLLGGACHLARHAQETAEYRVFHEVSPEFRSVRGVMHAIGPSNCSAVIQLGLLILIATPIARVAFSLAGFAFERDWTYVAITSIVLAVLLYSVAGEH
jgi:uncharacterized membrane protein